MKKELKERKFTAIALRILGEFIWEVGELIENGATLREIADNISPKFNMDILEEYYDKKAVFVFEDLVPMYKHYNGKNMSVPKFLGKDIMKNSNLYLIRNSLKYLLELKYKNIDRQTSIKEIYELVKENADGTFEWLDVQEFFEEKLEIQM
jgi:hypothetical protein